MVLLYQIVQVFRGSNFGPRAALMFAENFPRRSGGRLVAVERDLLRHPVLALERPTEKRFGGRDIPLGAKQEIDRLSLLVDSAIEVSPAAFDLHVGLVDAPRGAGPACKAIPPLFEFRDIALDLAHDRRMGERNTPLGHHLYEISKAELEPEIPADAEDNDLPVEMAPFEKISMPSIRVRFLKRRVCGDYASLQPFAPEPID